ncbi:hypothetical protein SAMN05216356_10786 [Oribacterium sp. WCC10]|nr:hypothetical protein SAMN05216356_10786 [Oribacterium sp. WCC10]
MIRDSASCSSPEKKINYIEDFYCVYFILMNRIHAEWSL